MHKVITVSVFSFFFFKYDAVLDLDDNEVKEACAVFRGKSRKSLILTT